MKETKIEKIMDKVLKRAVRYQVSDLVEECLWELDRMGRRRGERVRWKKRKRQRGEGITPHTRR